MKNFKKTEKSYQERVKLRMGKYYDEKPLKMPCKSRKNNMKETMYIPDSTDVNVVKRKITKAASRVHPQDRKKVLKVKLAKKNLQAIISKTFDFNPEDYLEKSLLFDLKKTSEEKFFDVIIEKLPDNGKYYIEHTEGTNAFRIRKDERQVEKDKLIRFIADIDKKISKATNKLRISQLKPIRNDALRKPSNLRKTFVDIDDKKTKTLDALLKIDKKIAAGEIEKSELAKARCERARLLKKYRELGGSYV